MVSVIFCYEGYSKIINKNVSNKNLDGGKGSRKYTSELIYFPPSVSLFYFWDYNRIPQICTSLEM